MLAVAAVAASVTLGVSAYVGDNQQRVHIFTGRISSAAAGEYVEVLGRYCGANGDRLITATRTPAGGRWSVENPHRNKTIGDDHIGRTPHFAYTPVYSGTVFRARWKRSYSAPFDWRVLALPKVARVAGHAHVGRPRSPGDTLGRRRLRRRADRAPAADAGRLEARPQREAVAQAERPLGHLQLRGTFHGADARPTAAGVPPGGERRAVLQGGRLAPVVVLERQVGEAPGRKQGAALGRVGRRGASARAVGIRNEAW